MANGRKKKHHAHELGDPYAEGWAAREAWNDKTPRPVNPYRPVPSPPNARKCRVEMGVQDCFEAQVRTATMELEIAQWDLGWSEWEADFEKDDLDEVVPSDFKDLGKRPTPPRREEDYD